MRNFEFYDLKSEMPAPKNQQIEFPNFMIPENDDNVNDPDKLTVRDYIRLVAVIVLCWFFFYMEKSVIIGLIGVLASLSVLFFVGGGRDALDRISKRHTDRYEDTYRELQRNY